MNDKYKSKMKDMYLYERYCVNPLQDNKRVSGQLCFYTCHKCPSAFFEQMMGEVL